MDESRVQPRSFRAVQRGLPGAREHAGRLPSVGDYGVRVWALGPQAEMEGVGLGLALRTAPGRAVKAPQAPGPGCGRTDRLWEKRSGSEFGVRVVWDVK
ncbi:unnamed protein product [Rangifer tarandus platyrhynchus]|uniref:Uncharacterized protein n=1 Tax=Rangifer tarandus platyrhynchus TaxID=3082113 RepID=A0AC59Y432_RANTA